MRANPRPGRLLVVATPLGNLSDLSPRQAEALAQADLIAAEDTRRTLKLVNHLGLKARLVACHEHNQARAAAGLVAEIKAGKTVALVTDAGTPAVSDPGHLVVSAAHEAGLPVSPVAGPSAVAAALSVAGLPADRYYFAGFPPAKAKARRDFLTGLARLPVTMVFFEAPHRLEASLADLAEILGPRPAVLGRELTKLNEEIVSAPLTELAERYKGAQVKGEITLVVAGADEDEALPDRETIVRAWRRARAEGLSASRAAREVAQGLGVGRSLVYKIGLEEDEA